MNDHPYPCPLGEEHCGTLDYVLAESAKQKYWLDKLEQCGLGQPKLMADCVRRLQISQALKDHFFPGHV